MWYNGGMTTEQLNFLVAVIFALIGASLLWFGIKRKNRFMKALGTSLLGGAGVAVFVESAQLREILTAAASVFAIFISALSIDEARRLRKDSLDRENRDRKERLLNEIIEWAISIAKCESESPMTVLPFTELVSFEEPAQQKVVEYVNRFDRVQLMRRYQAVDARSESIKAVAKELDKKFEGNLFPIVRRTASELAKNITIISKHLEGQSTEEEYNKHWHSLVENTIALTKKTAKIKAKGIG